MQGPPNFILRSQPKGPARFCMACAHVAETDVAAVCMLYSELVLYDSSCDSFERAEPRATRLSQEAQEKVIGALVEPLKRSSHAQRH